MNRRPLEQLWYQPGNSLGTFFLGLTLEPLSWAYRLGWSLSGINPVSQSVGRRVISIGNLTAGGNGKTPLAIELIEILSRKGKRIAVISRGYGRKSRGVVVVQEPGRLPVSWNEAGDEPLFIALRCPQAVVVVGEDRVAAARRAVEVGDPDLILCDDAFQHRRLHRDLNILAIHAQRGFGNGRLLPRGPLREPRKAVSRAQLVVFTYDRGESLEELRERHRIAHHIPAVSCNFKSVGFVQQIDSKAVVPAIPNPVMLVSAIANPDGFVETCQEAGCQIAGVISFPDHHWFDSEDFENIGSQVSKLGAKAIVVTEKDMVRLSKLHASVPLYALRLKVSLASEHIEKLVGLALSGK